MMNHRLPVEVEGKRAIICNEARIENGKFVDPNTMRTFSYNSLTRQLESVDPDPLKSISLQSTMQSIVQNFAQGAVHNGKCAGYDATDGVTIVISGSSISKENFRTGTLVMRVALKSNGQLSGTISLKEHFYENKNADSEQASEFKDTVPGSSDDGKSVNPVKKTCQFYTTWTKEVQERFELLTSEDLDKLRRKAPHNENAYQPEARIDWGRFNGRWEEINANFKFISFAQNQ
jgi:hypothetical protein